MSTYQCTVIFDASVTLEIKADSPEAAEALAMDHDDAHIRLCHQCSKEVDFGDATGVIVCDESNTTELLDTTCSAQTLGRLQDRIAELERQLAERGEAVGWLDGNFAGSVDNKEYYAKVCEDYMKDCLDDKDVQKHWKQIKSNNDLYAKLIRES